MGYYKIIALIYLGLIVLFSLISFIAFCADKKKAVKGKMRTKEKTLLFLATFNGALGAFLGRIVAHHKTDKSYFSIVIYLSLLLQACTLVLLGYFAIAK